MAKINLYFGILLLLAALVMAGLAMVTGMQVFRLRSKRMSWRGGTLKGFPLFSTLFLGISLTLMVVLWQTGGLWDVIAAGLYLIFSGSWFISSYFSSKRYITDHGIVKNVNDPAQTVAWHQIYDFYELRKDNYWRYIFMYREKDDGTLKKIVRLKLLVPVKKHPSFKKLISHKLGRRISCYENETIDVNHFE